MAKKSSHDVEAVRRKLSAIEEVIDAHERSFFSLHRELSELVHGLPREIPREAPNSLFGRVRTFIGLPLPIPSSITEELDKVKERLGDEWRLALQDSDIRLIELELATKNLLDRYADTVQRRPHIDLAAGVGADLLKWLKVHFDSRIEPCRKFREELRQELETGAAETKKGPVKKTSKRGRPSKSNRDLQIYEKVSSGQWNRKQIREEYKLSSSTFSKALKRGEELAKSGMTTASGPEESPPVQEKMVEITGRVLLPDGSPAVRAHIYVLRSERNVVARSGRHTVRIVHPDVRRIMPQTGFTPDVLYREVLAGNDEPWIAFLDQAIDVVEDSVSHASPTASTGADGGFQISVLASWLPPRCFDGLQLVACADGFGPAWATLSTEQDCSNISLGLVDDLPISGRIIDSKGNPLRQVPIRVGTILGNHPKTVETWRQAVAAYAAGDHWRYRELRYDLETFPGSCLPNIFRIVWTDDSGRFRLAGIGAGRIVQGMEVYAGKTARDQFSVVTEPTFHDGPKPSWPALRTYAAEFEHIVTRPRSVTGIVRDTFWDRGIPCATVMAEGPTEISCLTDRDGRYELLGAPDSDTLTLIVSAGIPTKFPLLPPSVGYPRTSRTVKWKSGRKRAHLDFDLPPGVVVHGKLRDRATGVAITGATICYAAQKYNPLLESMFEYAGQREAKHGGKRRILQLVATRTRTEDNGVFRLVGLPGFGFLAVSVPGDCFSVVSNAGILRRLAKYSVPDLSDAPWNCVRKVDLPAVPSFTVDLWVRRS